MIGYVTLGTNDKEKANSFYSAIFGAIGGKCVANTPNLSFWSTGEGPAIAVGSPENGDNASVGNGSMVAIPVSSAKQVDELHELALKLGGTDEGAPGDRGNNFYGGYFRDVDGNKLVFYATI